MVDGIPVRAAYRLLVVVACMVHGHDVYDGSTTLECPCETSGTVMLRPGETLTVHTDVNEDLRNATLGNIATDDGVDPYVTGGINLAQFKADEIECNLEFFSVVWHCPTHKNIVLPANGTYTFTVPEKASQVATYFAWGTVESPGLSAGFRVPYDAALARSIAGYWQSTTSALLVGNVMAAFIIGVYILYAKRNDVTPIKIGTQLLNCLGVVLHLYNITLPLLWACLQKNLNKDAKVQISWFTCVDAFSVMLLIMVCWCEEYDDKDKDDDTSQMTNALQFAVITLCTAVLYFILAFALPGAYWYVLGAVFAFALLVFTVYVWRTKVSWNWVCLAQAIQCLGLCVWSIILLIWAAISNRNQQTYFAFSFAKWLLLACCFVVLSLAMGAIKLKATESVFHPAYSTLGGAMFATAYVLMLSDSANYVVVVCILGGIVYFYYRLRRPSH